MDKPNILLYKKDIDQFCKKNHIDCLSLFGSILTTNFSSSSDVDFFVKFEKGFTPNFFDLVDMESELGSIIGHKVDLRTPNELSSYFREEVLSQAKVVYGELSFL